MVIEHVVHDRPLARMQERLDHEGDLVGVVSTGTPDIVEDGVVENEETSGVEEVENEAGGDGDGDDAATTGVNGHADNTATTTPTETTAPTPAPSPPPKIKHKMLLHNNDNELLRIEEVSPAFRSLPFLFSSRVQCNCGFHLTRLVHCGL